MAQEHFRRDAAERVDAIRDAIHDRLSTVRTLAAFFSGSELVEPQEFQTFVTPTLEKRVEIEALGWAPRVTRTQRPAFEQAVRREGVPQFEITEKADGGSCVRAAERDAYCPIRFLEPRDANKALLGFDLLSSPNCAKAIHWAKLKGQPAIWPCLPQTGIAGDRPQLWIVQPAQNQSVAHRNLPDDQPSSEGVVFAVVDARKLVEAAIKPLHLAGINIAISVSTDGGERRLFFHRRSRLSGDKGPFPSEDRAAVWPTYTGEIDVAGTQFHFDCHLLEGLLARDRSWAPAGMLLAGLSITALLTGYLILLTGRAARVERLVADRTLALCESEQRFRLLVDNAADAMFLHDQQGKIVDVNRRACESLGYSREELLAMSVADIDMQLVAADLPRYWRLPSEDYPVTFEGVHRRKNGSEFPVEIRLAPLSAGGQRYFLATARDLTDRKQLQQAVEESERKLRGILDHTFQFIGLMTPEGILTKANKSALAFSGVSEGEVLGKPFWETPWWSHSPALQEELRLAVQRAAQGDFVRMEATHLAANGDLHWIDFSLKPVKDETGRVAFLIPEGRDITDRKRIEEALRREQRLLRDLLDLHEQDRKLVAYEIHDGLAQQLVGALYKFQSVDALRERDPDAAREMFDEAVRLLREAAAETRRLIGGLRPPILDESGVVAAIEYVISEQRQYDGPDIEFLHPEKFDRLAAPLESAIFRVVQEALTNACRYSRSKLVVVELRQEVNRVHVEVRDEGVGFDPERVEAGHFGLRGICERARLLGGEAEIISSPGRGTRIHVELPRLLPA